jgi:hypothetical protein
MPTPTLEIAIAGGNRGVGAFIYVTFLTFSSRRHAAREQP